MLVCRVLFVEFLVEHEGKACARANQGIQIFVRVEIALNHEDDLCGEVTKRHGCCGERQGQSIERGECEIGRKED